MSFNRYYQDELESLLELGREFAERNPMLAPFLSTRGKDPDVERLMEGFAFLSGRLRQKLDDELPEITHSLFSLLWPNYLRPLPSCSIIQYKATEKLSSTVTIPRGTIVESRPVEGTACKFRTVYNTDVLPIELVSQTFVENFGSPALSLRFSITDGNIGNIDLKRLLFFFNGEPSIAFSFYFTLLAKVKEVRFILRDKQKKEHITGVLPPERIRAMGFKEEESMLPYPANTFAGYRLMQEYFCFSEKFLFLELGGIEEALPETLSPELSESTEFELQFPLKALPEQAESFRKDNIKLFCTPVVNLFSTDSTPLLIDHRREEYRIVPDPKTPYHFACYSVDSVDTWQHNTKFRRSYVPFESFEHNSEKDDGRVYYRLRMRPSLHDAGTETYISIIYMDKSGIIPEPETISLELTCTNRLLPGQLDVGDINVHGKNTPEVVTFKNITPITPSYAPPLENDLLWRLISNMSLNYISLVNIKALRSIVSAYDFRALHNHQRAIALERILSGMVKVECEATDRIYKSLPLRGSKTLLTLNRRCFSCEGEMWLFASIINEFLALYATVNSFHQLAVVEEKTGEKYEWPARLGSTTI